MLHNLVPVQVKAGSNETRAAGLANHPVLSFYKDTIKLLAAHLSIYFWQPLL